MGGRGKLRFSPFNIGKRGEMDEGGYRKTEVDSEKQPETRKQEFRSSFKAWIRIVAFVVVAVFLPEQFAQAMEYDWRVLWQKPIVGAGAFTPPYLRDVRQADIPLTVKNILLDIAGKPITSVRISPELTVELEKPLNISKKRIEELYNWLQGKPCGTKALYDFLSYKGKQVQEQDIAVMALTVDILNDTIKPVGNPKIIKNSLYALSKASEFFGQKLYPVKIANLEMSNLAPFIAHLNGDHYILVTRIDNDKIYFSDNHKEGYIPKDKFLAKFSGNAEITVDVFFCGK